MDKKKVIAWWSGGVTSAVACKKCIELYGIDNVSIIFIDTKNEHNDTYRFLKDCEKWYGKEIDVISNQDFASIRDVWYKYLSLNTATGAICSTILKRKVREEWQKENTWDYQAFGFDAKEVGRAISMTMNNPKVKAIYPLLMFGILKKDCVRIIIDAGVDLPIPYKMGYLNNNCFKTGCVQGGIGYWQKIREDDLDKFNEMANIEHELTDLKGEPVTICKDQSKDAVKIGSYAPVFLLPHPDYPQCKDISMMKGRKPEPLMECNGFCGLNDLDYMNKL